MRQHFFTKKLFSLIVSVTLLFSLTACTHPAIEQQPPTIAREQQHTQTFTEFTRHLFCEAVSKDTLTLHSYLEHPEHYDLHDYQVTLGRYDFHALDPTAELTDAFHTLQTFDRETLSDSEKITFDELMIYFQNELEYSDLYLFSTPLCITTGIHVQLPLILSEYTFLEEKDITDYLQLLNDADGYFKNLIDYETLRSQNGYFMEDSLATQIINECKTFMETADTGCLITSFAERLDTIGLSDEAKHTYLSENEQAIKMHVIPGYQILIDGLTKLVGTNRYKGGLCNYPNGQNYYTYLLNASLGWSKSIDDYNSLIDSYIRTNLSAMQTLLARDASLSSKFNTFSFHMKEPNAILEDLKTKIVNDFPPAVTGDYSIKYVAPSLQDSVSPAMYFIPQLDYPDNNSIYINPKETSETTLYATLAHEGYPGHLYQTTYFAHTNPDLIRYLLAYNGYVEGWATYCELLSYSYANSGNATLNALMQANQAIILCLYAKCDIGINYYNWTQDDVYSFIADYGFTDTSVAAQMYRAMISNPGNYCKYVLGWIAFSELKKQANRQLGSNFTNKAFHKYVLDYGSVPFDILFDNIKQIKEWEDE